MLEYSLFLFLVFVTFDPTAYIVTEGVNSFADLRLVRSGDLSGSTTITVTPRSGTATGTYHDSTIQKIILTTCISNHCYCVFMCYIMHAINYAWPIFFLQLDWISHQLQ